MVSWVVGILILLLVMCLCLFYLSGDHRDYTLSIRRQRQLGIRDRSGSPCDGLVRLRLRPASPQTPTTSASAISNAYSCADDDDEDRHTYLAAAAAQRALILRIEAVLPDARLQAVMDASPRPDGFVTLFCRQVKPVSYTPL